MATAYVSIHKNEFMIKCEDFDNDRAKQAPESDFRAETYAWHLPAIASNARYLLKKYKDEVGAASEEVFSVILDLIEVDNTQKKEQFPEWFKFKNNPRPYQMDALNKAWGKDEFALFMEMRTGKSFVLINLLAAQAQIGKINAAVIVLFPGAIKATWEIQLEEHMPIDYTCHLMQSGKSKRFDEFMDAIDIGFKVLVIGIESLSAGAGPGNLIKFADTHRIAFAIDESTCIKNPKALTKQKKRTRVKLCWDVGGTAIRRYILTGTPVTQGIEDLYSQFRFLNWNIIGHKSFFTYKRAHCIVGGFQDKKIIGYADVDGVLNSIAPYVYQITTKDAIGIPEEVNESILVDPTPVQAKMLKELGDPFVMSTEHEGDMLEIETVLERMARYQQIVGGNFPYKPDETLKKYTTKPIVIGGNPKIDAMMGVIDALSVEAKVIIWARFVPEIEQIQAALEKKYGGHEVIVFKGGMSDVDRKEAQLEFMRTNGPRFWVATQQASARGIELAAASIHIFYSNSFSYDDRKQASMRTSSSHQKSKSVVYVDIIMNHKIDKQIIKSLRKKQGIAKFVQEEIDRLNRA